MERVTLIQYLTALQGALRAIVALCSLILFVLSKNRPSYVPAFKYLRRFIGTIGIWGFFSSIFFFCPNLNLLPFISPWIYVSMGFAGPSFMKFCFAYAQPHKESLTKALRWNYLFPCIYSLCTIVPPLQKYTITFTNEIIYIPYRDILEYYHPLFYGFIIYLYATILVGIAVIVYKSIRNPEGISTGAKFAMVAAVLFIVQNMVASFIVKNNVFFWIPSLALLACMILLFLTLYHDESEQIISKGYSDFLEFLPFPVAMLDNNFVIYLNNSGKEFFSSLTQLNTPHPKEEDLMQFFTVFDMEIPFPTDTNTTSQKFIQLKQDKTLYFLQEQEIIGEERHKNHGKIIMITPLTSMQYFFSDLEDKAFRDNLCNCYNRHFLTLKQKELLSSELYPISLLVCDIDNLKGINDTLGHKRGDEYIIACHDGIRSCIRKDDLIFRLGGDEFLVLLPKTAAPIAKAIVKSIDAEMEQHREFTPHRIGISIGIATLLSPDSCFEEALKEADVEMYKIKAQRKEHK